MVLNFIKNTVLILVLTVVSCGSEGKNITANNNEILKQVQNDKDIIVGANQTEKYLPLLNGKKVGIVANQTSVVFKNELMSKKELAKWNIVQGPDIRKEIYTHIVDSLISLKVNITKVFSPEHGFRGKADAGELVFRW